MTLDIPGRGILRISHIVCDFNGTLAEDGLVADTTMQLLQALGQAYQVTVVTADTFGTAEAFARRAGVDWHRIDTGEDKKRFVQSLSGGVAAVGNGANDAPMFQAADLAVAIIGPEGAATRTLACADIAVASMDKGLELFLKPKRIVATLRE